MNKIVLVLIIIISILSGIAFAKNKKELLNFKVFSHDKEVYILAKAIKETGTETRQYTGEKYIYKYMLITEKKKTVFLGEGIGDKITWSLDDKYFIFNVDNYFNCKIYNKDGDIIFDCSNGKYCYPKWLSDRIIIMREGYNKDRLLTGAIYKYDAENRKLELFFDYPGKPVNAVGEDVDPIPEPVIDSEKKLIEVIFHRDENMIYNEKGKNEWQSCKKIKINIDFEGRIIDKEINIIKY